MTTPPDNNPGYAAVRAALKEWFVDAQIDGVSAVFKTGPWYLDGSTWSIPGGTNYSAVLFVHIDSSAESRITLPAPNAFIPGQPIGQKQVMYVVSVVIQYKYLIPSDLPPGEAEDAWVDGLDLIIDQVKARIRLDPTQGGTDSYSAIFQAGQSEADIRLEQDLPIIDEDGGIVYSLSRVEFDLTSIIIA